MVRNVIVFKKCDKFTKCVDFMVRNVIFSKKGSGFSKFTNSYLLLQMKINSQDDLNILEDFGETCIC